MGACRELPEEYFEPKKRTLPDVFLDEFVEQFIKLGRKPDVAMTMAQACVNRALRNAGEGLYWVPKAFDYGKPTRTERDMIIVSLAYQGKPISVIRKTFGLSRSRVYAILAQKSHVSSRP